jgi:hypothetical protein
MRGLGTQLAQTHFGLDVRAGVQKRVQATNPPRVARPTGASVSYVLPAVDREDLAGDEVGVRAGKEFDRA